MTAGTAKSRWGRLDNDRSSVLARGRACAELTLPYILPPDGANQNTTLPTPYQSIGARAVNNIASKLLLALFPPATSFVRLTVDEAVLEELGVTPERVEEPLRKVENRLMGHVEAGKTRGVLFMALKHLPVTGNALVYMPSGADPRMFRLDQYVVSRDSSDRLLEVIIREEVAPETLDSEVREACDVNMPVGGADSKQVEVFTHAELIEGTDHLMWRQEINGKIVPGSEGMRKETESPFLVLRWQAIPGEDYGRGLVEEYLGDLRSHDGLSKSILKFSAAVAKIIFLHHPNSVTDIDELVRAESGDFVSGDAKDIDVLQIEKYHDFQVAKQTLDDLTLRLSHAFLLQSGTVRDAERVTAEEIRAMAQELEDVLGGVYTMLSNDLQVPFVRRHLAMMKDRGELRGLVDTGVLEPKIVTGFDALGRGHELNRFRAFYADLAGIVGPEAAQQLMSSERVAQMLATKHNVDIASLLKTEEELEQEQQAAMAQQLMDKAAGPVAGAAAKGMTE